MINKFNSGEISESLHYRADLDLYSRGLKKCVNFIPTPQGELLRRPGTYLVRMLGASNEEIRLIPFYASEKNKFLVCLTSGGLFVLPANYRFQSFFRGDFFSKFFDYEKGSRLFVNKVFKIPLQENTTDKFLYFYTYDDKVNSIEFYISPYPTFQLSYDINTKRITVFSGSNLNIVDFLTFLSSEIERFKKDLFYIEFALSLEASGMQLNLSFLNNTQFNPFKTNKWYICKQDNNFYSNHFINNIDKTNFWEEYDSQPDFYFNKILFSTTSPYKNNEIFDVKYAQVNDILILTHKNYPPKQIRYNGQTFEFLDFEFDVTPFKIGNDNENHKLWITFENNKYYLNSNQSYFTSNLVNSFFRLKYKFPPQEFNVSSSNYPGSGQRTWLWVTEGSTWRLNITGDLSGIVYLDKRSGPNDSSYVTLRSFVIRSGNPVYIVSGEINEPGQISIRISGSSGTANVSLVVDPFQHYEHVKIVNVVNATKAEISNVVLPLSDQTYLWNEGSFSDKSGYPSIVGFYKNRIFFASTKAEPNTIWFSKSDNFYDFSSSIKIKDTDGFSLLVNDGKYGDIVDIKDIGTLVVLTDTSEWYIQEDRMILSPTTVSLQKISEFGCEPIGGISLGNSVFYIQNNSGILREIFYSDKNQSFVSQDISVFANHLFKGKKPKRILVQKEPFNIIWILFEDKSVIMVTYSKEYEILGFSRFEIGKSSYVFEDFVKEICVVPSNGGDNVYFVVRRGRNNYLECLSDYFFLDRKEINFKSITDCSLWLFSYKDLNFQDMQNFTQNKYGSDMNFSNFFMSPTGDFKKLIFFGIFFNSEIETLPLILKDGNYFTFDKKTKIQSISLIYKNLYGGLGLEIDNNNVPIQTDPTSTKLEDGIKNIIMKNNYKPSQTLKLKTSYTIDIKAILYDPI